VDDEPRTGDETRRQFAAALRQARLKYGSETGQGEITQKDFAKMLGISGERPEERYRLYENAKREPPLWILAAVRRVTGFSLDDLIAQLPAGRRLEREPPTAPRNRPPPFREMGAVKEKPDRASADCPPLRVVDAARR